MGILIVLNRSWYIEVCHETYNVVLDVLNIDIMTYQDIFAGASQPSVFQGFTEFQILYI